MSAVETRVLEMNLEGMHMPGKDRPRFSGGVTYDTPRNKAFQKRMRDEWLCAHDDSYAGWRGPVAVRVAYQNPRPKSVPEGSRDLTKPDVDNVLKLVMDALNGTAWRDDAQVVYASCEKARRYTRRFVYLRVEVSYLDD